MEKFLSLCVFLFLLGSVALHFSGILIFLLILGVVHYCYALRIFRFSEAKSLGKIGKLDEVRQGVETRMWVAFLYLLVLDVAFYSATTVVDKETYITSKDSHVNEIQMGIFMLMVIGGGFLAAYFLFSMMRDANKASEVKKYLLALSVASISGGIIGFMLSSWQYIVIPFSGSSVMVFASKDVAPWLAYLYVLASFFSARYSCKSGDRAVVYFLGSQVYCVDGHGDVVVPVPSLTLQLILDLIKQDYLLFSIDWEAVRQPLTHSAPHRTLNLRIDHVSPSYPIISVPVSAPVTTSSESEKRPTNRSSDLPPDDSLKESRLESEIAQGAYGNVSLLSAYRGRRAVRRSD